MGPTEQNSLASVLGKLDRLLDRYVGSEPASADLAGHSAFAWDGRRSSLDPVQRPVRFESSDLLGIDRQRELVLANTRTFLDGGRANNVLLWGERGTGKSTLVRSLLTAFSGSSLRMVQVMKHDVLTIPHLYGTVAGRSERFLLVIDDLSFEQDQTDYQEMKTVMDGGLEQVPENLLFYATSNRKHLLPTRFSDQDNDAVRPEDSIEEKVSLADRFGLRLGFYHFDQDTYLAIVDRHAERAGIGIEREVLHREAVRWALAAGGRNGRVAEQFVRSLPAG